jgi:hypothetical protein
VSKRVDTAELPRRRVVHALSADVLLWTDMSGTIQVTHVGPSGVSISRDASLAGAWTPQTWSHDLAAALASVPVWAAQWVREGGLDEGPQLALF